jgi:hypothetical protein
MNLKHSKDVAVFWPMGGEWVFLEDLCHIPLNRDNLQEYPIPLGLGLGQPDV